MMSSADEQVALVLADNADLHQLSVNVVAARQEARRLAELLEAAQTDVEALRSQLDVVAECVDIWRQALKLAVERN